MVPLPVWEDRPVDSWKTVPSNVATSPTEPLPAQPFIKNVSGKAWKQPRPQATVRSQGKGAGNKRWSERLEERKKMDAVKRLAKEMQDEKKAEIKRKRTITKERQDKAKEKLRLEEMAKRMSAKKLQRMQKRLGRTKKVNH
ncbi:BQ5605_C002g01124 [Microbotryum silenes-dioicae]|uniref:rRNA-processing protein n=1 Tax=Microbotryum silenes-dioicae TaxID=796604 RepID=A0A2X0NVJ7_9BASI|nr:BQ5605_C002g01124 [Microbotryum silenes-dioicae]